MSEIERIRKKYADWYETGRFLPEAAYEPESYHQALRDIGNLLAEVSMLRGEIERLRSDNEHLRITGDAASQVTP